MPLRSKENDIRVPFNSVRDIEEFSDLAEQVDKSYALREFLKDYNGFTGSSKEIIALAIKSPIGKNAYLYQFTCSANDLAKASSPAVSPL